MTAGLPDSSVKKGVGAWQDDSKPKAEPYKGAPVNSSQHWGGWLVGSCCLEVGTLKQEAETPLNPLFWRWQQWEGDRSVSQKALAFSLGLSGNHQVLLQGASTTAPTGAGLRGSLAPDSQPQWQWQTAPPLLGACHVGNCPQLGQVLPFGGLSAL